MRAAGAALLLSLPACAELQSSGGAGPSGDASQAVEARQVTQAAAAAQAIEPGPTALIDARLSPVPEEFAVEDQAVWDGRRTLQGIWVAHPAAETARRVRIVNVDTGYAVDGALFRRDGSGPGPAVLVSSDAAAALGMTPDRTTTLSIVAIKRAPTPPAAALAAAEPEPETPTAAVDELDEDVAAAPSIEADEAPAETAPTTETGTETSAETLEADLAAALDASDEASAAGSGAEREADAAPQTPAEADPEPAQDLGFAALDTTPPSSPRPAAPSQPAPDTGALEADLTERLGTDSDDSARVLGTLDGAPSAALVPPQPATQSPGRASEAEIALETPARAEPEAADPAPADAEAAIVVPDGGPFVEDWPIAEQGGPSPAEAEPADTAAEPAAPAAEEAPTRTAALSPEAAAPAPTTASELDRPFIQAGLFGVKSNATRLIARIEEAGFPAVGKEGTYGDRVLTRVVAGPFATRAERDQALRAIRGLGPSDALPVAR